MKKVGETEGHLETLRGVSIKRSNNLYDIANKSPACRCIFLANNVLFTSTFSLRIFSMPQIEINWFIVYKELQIGDKISSCSRRNLNYDFLHASGAGSD